MPKSQKPPSQGASSRRAAPTKVSKPFPWGTVLGSTVLGALLIGIIAYAALNQGSGVSNLLTNPDQTIEGVAVAEPGSLERDHVEGPVDYAQTPPNGGAHNAVPQQCAVYAEPIAPEHAVHSLEHGAVWITYNDDVSDEDVAALTDLVEGDPYRMLSPVPEQSSPINLSAWGRRLSVDTPGDDRVGDFLQAYTAGRQAPEPGAACVGTTATGPVQAGAAEGATDPSTTVTVPPAPASAAPEATPATS